MTDFEYTCKVQKYVRISNYIVNEANSGIAAASLAYLLVRLHASYKCPPGQKAPTPKSSVFVSHPS